MKISYVNLGSLPNQKAHPVQIFNTCSALASEGAQVQLLARHAAIKRGTRAIAGNWPLPSADYFGVAQNFELVRPARAWQNVFKRQNSRQRFVGECAQFLMRRASRPDFVYTRQTSLAFRLAAHLPLALEAHDFDIMNDAEMRPLLQGWRAGHYPQFRGIVAISQTLADGLIERGVPASHILVAHDGIDPTRFENPLSTAQARALLQTRLPDSAALLDAARPIVGYCGHFYEGRGIELLLECARRRPDWTFLLVGGFEEDLARYRQIAQSNALQNVVFTGYVSNADLAPYLWASDVLTMPYQFEQQNSRFMSPMKMFEYMATNRAIVTADWPQIREVLQPEQSALFYPRNNANALETALERALNDAALRHKLSQNARRDVENYTWRARARRILNWIEQTPALKPDN